MTNLLIQQDNSVHIVEETTNSDLTALQEALLLIVYITRLRKMEALNG